MLSAATNPWVTPFLAAFTVKPTTDAVPFYDRGRSSSVPVQVTDVNVGALKTVMNANPDVFATGIIYAWDSTGLNSDGSSGSARPMTGMRLWNAGQLPDTGLVFGTNDPGYLRGGFNDGSTLVTTTDPESASAAGYLTKPATSNISVVDRNTTSTADQRHTSDYTIKPAGLFADSICELSLNFKDATSKSGNTACSNTINLVEGWTTMQADERRSDDTYLDPNGLANPLWVENWGAARREMQGEEMVLWHSRYNTANAQGNGSWRGAITYNAAISNLPLNWGGLTFVRERYLRR